MPVRITIIAGRVWAKFAIISLRLICGIKMEIRGKEYTPKGGAIVACKHQSAWETFIFYALCDSPVYILKKELTNIPIFGWYMKAIKTIELDRKKGIASVKYLINQSCDRIEKNRQVIIFPEGTRIKSGEKGKYKAGIAAIYLKADVPVTPVALNSGVCWGKNSYIKRSGTIIIEFLPPIEQGLKKTDFMKTLEDKIEKASNNLLD